jgi:hypothetical protein
VKIDFVRSGGFGGLRLSLTLDTEGLPVEEASRIRQLVDSAGFFDLDQVPREAATERDRFEYRVAIESQVWGSHAVLLPESRIPDDMRPLLDYLTGAAMRRTGSDKRPSGQGGSPA